MAVFTVFHKPLPSPDGGEEIRGIAAIDQSAKAANLGLASHRRMWGVDHGAVKGLAYGKKIVVGLAHGWAAAIPRRGEKKGTAVVAALLSEDVAFFCAETLDGVQESVPICFEICDFWQKFLL